MPVRTGRLVFGRAMVIAALVAAPLFFALLLLNSSSGYTVHALVSDAGQIVKGNEVQVGGVPIGTVDDVRLRDGGRSAELDLSINGDEAPLHEGTTATIRNPSLTSVAGRYVSLIPGPNSSPQIPDGGEIPSTDTTEIVDLDQLLNSLDPSTVADLSQVIHVSAGASGGRAQPGTPRLGRGGEGRGAPPRGRDSHPQPGALALGRHARPAGRRPAL